MKEDGLLPCARMCIEEKMCCEDSDCRNWIDYEAEQNCCLISTYENGPMTLREVADRLGISFARVKQIETQALQKLRKRCNIDDLLF